MGTVYFFHLRSEHGSSRLKSKLSLDFPLTPSASPRDLSPPGRGGAPAPNSIHTLFNRSYPAHRSPQTGTRVASRWNGAGAGAGSVALARHWAMSPQVPARPAVRLPPRSPTPVPEGKPTGRAAARSHILLRQAILGRPSSPPLPSPHGGSEGRVEASDSTPVGGPKGRMRGHQQPDGKPGVARRACDWTLPVRGPRRSWRSHGAARWVKEARFSKRTRGSPREGTRAWPT